MLTEEPCAAGTEGAQQAGPAKRPAGKAAQPVRAGKRQALGKQQSGPVQKSLTAFLKPHNRQAPAAAAPADPQARAQSAPACRTEPGSSAAEAACPGLQNRPEAAQEPSQGSAGAISEAVQQAGHAASQAQQGLSGGSSAWTEADLEEAHVRAMAEEEQGDWGGGGAGAAGGAQTGQSCADAAMQQVRREGTCLSCPHVSAHRGSVHCRFLWAACLVHRGPVRFWAQIFGPVCHGIARPTYAHVMVLSRMERPRRPGRRSRRA
jgi:hypothetical protein